MSEDSPTMEFSDIREQFEQRVRHLGSEGSASDGEIEGRSQETSDKNIDISGDTPTSTKSEVDSPGSSTTSPDSADSDSHGTEAHRTVRTDLSESRTNPFSEFSRIPDSQSSMPNFEVTGCPDDRSTIIDSGGNADVYLSSVQAEGNTREVAVKIPHGYGTVQRNQVHRLLDEAERWSKLDDHSHIVTVLGYGAESGLPWIAMEYMDSGNLASRIEEGSISIPEAIWIGYSLARALNHAHHRGVAHNDLKPANVLFRETSSDSWPIPKIADWGIAKELIRRSQSIKGFSPQYAAPEQFHPEEFGSPDYRTDIYQLGIIMYELLVGEPPFVGPPAKLMHEAKHGEVIPPTEIDSSLPDVLDRALLTALATKPENRYESVLYFRDALAEVASQVQRD